MRAFFASTIVFVVLASILTPLDLKFQREREVELARIARESAEFQARIARGEIPAPIAPRYPTDAEVEAYWKARGGYPQK
jgi:hypothetical protein